MQKYLTLHPSFYGIFTIFVCSKAIHMFLSKSLSTFGKYLILMGRTFSRPERMRMFFKQYIKEMSQLGTNSIGIVLLISFFIGAVICIQIKLNIEMDAEIHHGIHNSRNYAT